MNSAHAASTKELDRKTINATIRAFIAAEFAFAISGYSLAFESDKFFKEQLALRPPYQERVVLTPISLCIQQQVKSTYSGHMVPSGDVFFVNGRFLVEVVQVEWVKSEWDDRRNQRLASGVDGLRDACSILSCVLRDGGWFGSENTRVNLGERYVLPHLVPCGHGWDLE